MRRQRATLADRVSQVMEIIELGRRTGLLSVERDVGAALEEGDIYFLDGQAIYASTGTQSGRSALETLRTWGACRFAFLTDIPKPAPNIGPERGNVRPLQTGELRSDGSGPRPPADAASRSGTDHFSAEPFTRFGPRPYIDPPARPGPLSLSPPDLHHSLSRPLVAPHQRPRRAPNPQDVPRLTAKYQLSRSHRTLLLLADGEHTVRDLARLAGRSEEEALALLTDLIRLGLITILA